MNREGIILKSLSGFYYVSPSDHAEEQVCCRARGKFRHDKVKPLVGDRVTFLDSGDGTGMLEAILPRRNLFQRPAVANIDQLVIIASGAIPITDPFLIDRVVTVAERQNCDCVICFNKWDLAQPQELAELYRRAGFRTICLSAVTGEGIEELRSAIAGKVSAFTGNSGVGKSSILNAIQPGFSLQVGEVSERLGRGRHTTRHVELYPLDAHTLLADTPGFSAFDSDQQQDYFPKEELAATFREFRPYLDQCRFVGCSHRKERGCAVLEAVKSGSVSESRHSSYVRLYAQLESQKAWEQNK